MIDRRKLLPASLVCLALCAAGLIFLLTASCQVKRSTEPARAFGALDCYSCKAAFAQLKRSTEPARAFDEVTDWNTRLAVDNDRLASKVIDYQHEGTIATVNEAKAILVKQSAIAEADLQLSGQLAAAASCAKEQAGPRATRRELDAAAVKCAQISSLAIKAELLVIIRSLDELRGGKLLLAVKNPIKRRSLDTLLASMVKLAAQIRAALTMAGVIK